VGLPKRLVVWLIEQADDSWGAPQVVSQAFRAYYYYYYYYYYYCYYYYYY